MNPTKNDTTSRVLRGGSWLYNGPSWVRAASRSSLVPAYRSSLVGFRTALAGKMKR